MKDIRSLYYISLLFYGVQITLDVYVGCRNDKDIAAHFRRVLISP